MNFVTSLSELLAAPLFRDGADGRRVFLPSAMSSKRFIIPSPAVEHDLRSRMGRMVAISVIISLVLIFGTMAVFGSPREWTGPVWLFIISAFVVHFAVNLRLGGTLTSGLTESAPELPPGFLGAMQEQAVAWPRWMSWLQLIVGPLVLWGGILGYQDAATRYDLVLSVLALPLGGLMIAFGITGLLMRR